jgi:hypothetical protein
MAAMARMGTIRIAAMVGAIVAGIIVGSTTRLLRMTLAAPKNGAAFFVDNNPA